MPANQARAFRVIDLLATVLVIGLILGFLTPAVQSARENARRAQCVCNLKYIGLCMHNYFQQHHFFPGGPSSSAKISWNLNIYIENINSFSNYNSFNTMASIYSSENSTTLGNSWNGFQCPSDRDAFSETTNYAGCLGDGQQPGMFAADVAIKDITDGTSNTIAVSEFLIGSPAHRSTLRTYFQPKDPQGAKLDFDTFADRCQKFEGFVAPKGSDLAFFKGRIWLDPSPPFTVYNHVLPPNQPSCRNTNGSSPPFAITATSNHTGGVNCDFADGSVRFIRDTVNPRVWRALATYRGDEPLSPGEF